MAKTVITGNDTLVINNRVIQDLTDGSVIDLSFPTKKAVVKVGKNRNSLFAENTQGYSSDLKIRLLRRGGDDGFLLNLSNLQDQNFSGTTLLTGTFTKQVGDGQGGVSYDTYTLQGGIFVSQQPAMSNPEGNTEQASTVYEIVFSNVFRSAN